MSSLKPFLRITLLSTILAGLLIYLGIKYHWGDHLKQSKPDVVELAIPESIGKDEITKATIVEPETFDLGIVKNSDTSSTLLTSMNKEQMAEQCIKILSRTIKDELALELATANCVVSNYQETFQDNKITDEQAKQIEKRKIVFQNQCKQQYSQKNAFNPIESQLLIGICVSDRLTQK